MMRGNEDISEEDKNKVKMRLKLDRLRFRQCKLTKFAVNCHLGLNSSEYSYFFFSPLHLSIANIFTYCFQVGLWLFLQDGISKELDGQCLCEVGQVRRLQKFCRRVHGHWQFARSSLQQRKCQSYDGERKKNISAEEKKDMNMLSILTTFKGTAS